MTFTGLKYDIIKAAPKKPTVHKNSYDKDGITYTRVKDFAIIYHDKDKRKGGVKRYINGGFFALRAEIFDHIKEGEELVEKPFHRLIDKRQLLAYRYSGFWQAMDTFKDKINFDRMEAQGNCPWMVWSDKSSKR